MNAKAEPQPLDVIQGRRQVGVIFKVAPSGMGDRGGWAFKNMDTGRMFTFARLQEAKDEAWKSFAGCIFKRQKPLARLAPYARGTVAEPREENPEPSKLAKSWASFDFWFFNDGHWVYGTGAKGYANAVEHWKGHGIIGRGDYPGPRPANVYAGLPVHEYQTYMQRVAEESGIASERAKNPAGFYVLLIRRDGDPTYQEKIVVRSLAEAKREVAARGAGAHGLTADGYVIRDGKATRAKNPLPVPANIIANVALTTAARAVAGRFMNSLFDNGKGDVSATDTGDTMPIMTREENPVKKSGAARAKAARAHGKIVLALAGHPKGTGYYTGQTWDTELRKAIRFDSVAGAKAAAKLLAAKLPKGTRIEVRSV